MPHTRPDEPVTQGRIVMYCDQAGLVIPAVVTQVHGQTKMLYAPPLEPGQVHLAAFAPLTTGIRVGQAVPEDEHTDGAYVDALTPGTWRWPDFRRPAAARLA